MKMSETEFKTKMAAYDRDAARAVAKYDMWTADALVRAREIAAEMIREYKVIPKF